MLLFIWVIRFLMFAGCFVIGYHFIVKGGVIWLHGKRLYGLMYVLGGLAVAFIGGAILVQIITGTCI